MFQVPRFTFQASQSTQQGPGALKRDTCSRVSEESLEFFFYVSSSKLQVPRFTFQASQSTQQGPGALKRDTCSRVRDTCSRVNKFKLYLTLSILELKGSSYKLEPAKLHLILECRN